MKNLKLGKLRKVQNMNGKEYIMPNPIIDIKEEKSLVILTERYSKLTREGLIAKAGNKIGEWIPKPVKEIGSNTKEVITDTWLFTQCMKVVMKGFNVLEEQAAKMSISEDAIINKINQTTNENEITVLEEICLVRSYDISKQVSKYKMQDLGWAFAEGGITGYFGFAGLPFNLVLSTFLYYRAVQSIAMFYGYDVKNDSAELVIATQVFMSALAPNNKINNEITNIIGKVMFITELETVKQTVKKTWTDMAARGGVSLLITQMRALAHKSAQKALEKVGQKGLENSLFREVFEQIGKKLTQKVVAKSIPIVGGVVGALFDTAQMKNILEYADVFYNKRYILEKEERINILIGDNII